MKSRDGAEKSVSLKGKMEDFWYYHKMPVILGLVALLIGMVCFSDMFYKVPTDLNLYMVTAEPVSEGTINFDEVLSDVVQDIDGNGESDITISRVFLSADLAEENASYYQQSLETELANQGAVMYIFDRVNYERMVKKDAFCPLDAYLDVAAYGDRILYRDNVPVAVSLAGSKVLKEMEFTNDDLYALLLFQRPEDFEDTNRMAEYENAAAVLEALLQQPE